MPVYLVYPIGQICVVEVAARTSRKGIELNEDRVAICVGRRTTTLVVGTPNSGVALEQAECHGAGSCGAID